MKHCEAAPERPTVRRVVVVGTGTGVGKSYVTRALARALAEALPHAVVGALKPIETGLQREQGSSAEDAESFAALFHNASPPSPHPLFGYGAPLTPYLAARREGAPEPSLGRVRAWVEDWEARSLAAHEPPQGRPQELWTVVESAGGLFSPLASGPLTNLDLWLALEPCLGVLVARDGLGTLHEISATLQALAARGRRPDHLVLNAAGPPDLSQGTNAEVLDALGIARASAVLSAGATDLGGLLSAILDRAPSLAGGDVS